MRHDHADQALVVYRGYHMLKKGIITLGLGRNAVAKSAISVICRGLTAPVLKRKRRIGNDPVKKHQFAVLDQFWITNGIAFFYIRIRQVMQEHIHLADGPGAEIFLLAKERYILRVAFQPFNIMG